MRDKLRRIFRNVNPAILIIIAVLVVNKMLNSSLSVGDWLYTQILLLPGIIIGLTFHEAAHGFVSYWLGDPTPKLQGRLTLNPFSHIDPIGFLALFFAGFGWGQPVQIDPRYYKHRRRDELLVAVAGVVTNFIIAFAASLILKLMANNMGVTVMYGLGQIAFSIVYYIMTINIMLMIFNLIPVPPLDGFSILTQIFKLERYSWYYTVYNNGFFILMLLILFNITDMILGPGIIFFTNLFF